MRDYLSSQESQRRRERQLCRWYRVLQEPLRRKMTECPDEVDAVYLQRWDRYELKFESWMTRRSKATGLIRLSLSPAIKHRYNDDMYNHEPAQLWKQIAHDVGAVVALDGLVRTKLSDF